MTEKEKASFEVIDRVCADYQGNRKAHVVLQESLKIIYAGLNPPNDTVKVPKKKEDKKK